MCGLAGAIGSLDPAVLKAVRRMTSELHHRGPDSGGFWRSRDVPHDRGGAAFGFRRLAILDTSADGDQPMTDEDTGNVIVFNGEIYNFHELQRELKQYGARFHSRTDTEVLLKAYATWGIDCVTRLRGMFAFAIWDHFQKRVIIARDRLGIKPLYFSAVDRPRERQSILFASELRALLKCGLVQPRIDPVALRSYLWNGFVVGPHTIIDGIHLLPAGTLAVISADSFDFQLNRYWRIPTASPQHDGVGSLRDELQTAVQQHLVSDVPLGVFLSGGIDSSAIAAIAAKSVGSRLKTFNISFDEAEFDESKYAVAVARSIRSDHTEVRLTQQKFLDQFEDALAAIDQPTFDAINTYFVSRAVREAGITVALAGTGGDELFAGYRSFVDIPRAASVGRLLAPIPTPAIRSGAKLVSRLKHGRSGETPPQTRWGKLGDALATRGQIVDLYQTSYSLFTTDFIRRLSTVNSDFELRSGLPLQRWQELTHLVSRQEQRQAISMLELSCYVGERLLRDTDAASMAVSLEVRVPLLDHRVVESALAIDPARRFKPIGRKSLLREIALSELDPAIFNRPKSGFVLPYDRWCKEQLKGEVASMLCDGSMCEQVGLNPESVRQLWRSFERGAPGMYWSRVWSLFVLLWWCKRMNVAVPAESHA